MPCRPCGDYATHKVGLVQERWEASTRACSGPCGHEKTWCGTDQIRRTDTSTVSAERITQPYPDSEAHTTTAAMTRWLKLLPSFLQNSSWTACWLVGQDKLYGMCTHTSAQLWISLRLRTYGRMVAKPTLMRWVWFVYSALSKRLSTWQPGTHMK